jgi:alkylglycerol monooxygenase
LEAYGKILLIAMPVFLLLVLFEKWWGWKKNMHTGSGMDTISSLTTGW